MKFGEKKNKKNINKCYFISSHMMKIKTYVFHKNKKKKNLNEKKNVHGFSNSISSK